MAGFNLFGDLTKLNPTGTLTNTQKGSGVPGSQQYIDAHISELDKGKAHYREVGEKHGIHPALIAAIASRESCGGLAIKKSDGWGDYRNKRYNAYGIMQCDVLTSGLGEKCVSHPWDSKEHIELATKEILIPKIQAVQKKHPDWTKEQQLQGGVAAYNFGVKNVQSWEHLDKGSTNDDYSNDVIARAQHLISRHGW